MKRIILLIILFILPGVLYSQSAFKVLRLINKSKSHKIVNICRSTIVSPKNAHIAKNVVKQVNPYFLKINGDNGCTTRIDILTEFSVPILKNPETLYGGYNYLRIIASISKEKGIVDKKYLFKWKNINKTQGYNGVHHIINKSTLKEIHSIMKKEYRNNGRVFNIRLDEMQNNAPAIFHRLHGHPAYTNTFHNMEMQLLIYEQRGVSGIIDNFFIKAKLISASSRGTIPMYSYEVIRGTYLEAELWAKTFGLKW